MAQYAVLIFEGATELPPEVMEAHGSLPERIAQAGGRIVAGMALEDPGTATAIRGDLVTDGPFIESKEALAGFYLIEARDLNEAIRIASQIPPGQFGCIEVRPVDEDY
jgi:hypothetical protein